MTTYTDAATTVLDANGVAGQAAILEAYRALNRNMTETVHVVRVKHSGHVGALSAYRFLFERKPLGHLLILSEGTRVVRNRHHDDGYIGSNAVCLYSREESDHVKIWDTATADASLSAVLQNDKQAGAAFSALPELEPIGGRRGETLSYILHAIATLGGESPSDRTRNPYKDPSLPLDTSVTLMGIDRR